MKNFWMGVSVLLAAGLIVVSIALQDTTSQLIEIEENVIVQITERTHPRWILLYSENGLQCVYGPNAVGSKFIHKCAPDMSQSRRRKPL